jgi:hypothetical protein
MDNDRPQLDLKYFNDICPDNNGSSKDFFYELGDRNKEFFKFL